MTSFTASLALTSAGRSGEEGGDDSTSNARHHHRHHHRRQAERNARPSRVPQIHPDVRPLYLVRRRDITGPSDRGEQIGRPAAAPPQHSGQTVQSPSTALSPRPTLHCRILQSLSAPTHKSEV